MANEPMKISDFQKLVRQVVKEVNNKHGHPKETANEKSGSQKDTADV